MRTHFPPVRMKAESFHEDGAESEDRRLAVRSACPFQSWSQSKGSGGQKGSTERCPQPQKVIHVSPTLWQPKIRLCWKQPTYPSRSNLKRKKFDYDNQVLPDNRTGDKDRRPQHTYVHVEVKANEYQSHRLWGSSMTLIRPNGEKKAYVPLALDYDTLDVANKIGTV